MSHPARTYRQFSVQGATPLGLVVMLYDGAIAAIRRAAVAIEMGDVQQKCTDLNRALAIIAQLEGTLNFELGGEVAKTLKALYVYSRSQMLRANLENSSPILVSLIDKLATVREAWHSADTRPTDLPVPAAIGGGVSDSRPGTQSPLEPDPAEHVVEKSPYLPLSDAERPSWNLSA
jgi:flagellar secretion chaperone FliS